MKEEIKTNRLSTLTEKERAKSFERFRVLQPRIEDQISFTTISNETGVSVSTLKRWMQRYRECGLIGLARKSRSDRGRYRMNKELQSLIEALALEKPPRSVASIYRQTLQIAQRIELLSMSFEIWIPVWLLWHMRELRRTGIILI